MIAACASVIGGESRGRSTDYGPEGRLGSMGGADYLWPLRGLPPYHDWVRPPMRRSVLPALLALAVALAAPARAADPALSARLACALAVAHVDSSRSAAVAVDLATGEVVFARNAALALAPASTEKLTLSYALLTQL